MARYILLTIWKTKCPFKNKYLSICCVCVQERLLLSILPKHIADEMLQDMKKEPSQKEMQQFNTMYMYRHENVRYYAHTHAHSFAYNSI